MYLYQQTQTMVMSSMMTVGPKSIGLTVIIAIFSMPTAHANNFSDCSESFYGGIYPEFTNAKLSKNTQALCFDGFAVMYSGVTRTPLWSAEYLDRTRLNQAKLIDRDDSFHEESRLPQSMRAKLSDYSGSGFDRGHLAPNGNMANRSQQYDSFSMANIAPQSPRNNRYIWRNIESATRYLTQQYGEVYTVTGVAFTDKKLKTLENRENRENREKCEKLKNCEKIKDPENRENFVLVPSHFFKAVYIPAINQAGVYYAPNDESERIDVISIDALTDHIGIDVMPMLDYQVKSEALILPLNDSDGSYTPKVKVTNEQPNWLPFLVELCKWLMNLIKA